MRMSVAMAAALLGLSAADPGTILSQHAGGGIRVTIESQGWLLVGDFTPASPGRSPAVLLLNGAARDRTAYEALSRALAARGVASLRLDLRGHGGSTNLGRFVPGVSTGAILESQPDIAAALTWLRSRAGVDPKRVGMLGASYSGEDMAVVARTVAPAAAYVALSPGSLSDASAAAIDRAGRPWLFIASKAERFAGRVVGAIPKLSGTAQIMFVDGSSHASDILGVHPHLNGAIADWFASRLAAPRESTMFGSLERGRYSVGFRTTVVRGETTIHLAMWYPAASSGASAMTLSDYLGESPDLRGATEGFPAAADSRKQSLATAISGETDGVPSPTLDELLGVRFEAARDALPAHGRFPLVLWTPRYATPAMQPVLCEFLAEHGFVVAFARPEGTAALPFELKTPAARETELSARVTDMRSAVQYLDTQANVDARSIGVIAWSYTGEMATRFQMTEPRVRLVAGLSTTLLNDWVFQDREGIASLDARLTSAYAVLTQRGTTDADRPPGLDRVRGAAYFVEFPGLAHGSFNALEGYIPSLWGLTRVQRWSKSGPDGVRGYEAVARILRRLLNHHVAAGSVQPLPETDLLTEIGPEVATLSRYRP